MTKMIDRREWSEFHESGLLWWANRILHTFGWAIVFEYGEDDDGEPTFEVYPARVRFRGFGVNSEEGGFRKLSQYMVDNAEALKTEADE